ncbi:MAG: hypothetical protein UT63_C0044G0007 [Candidatus Gottesmanbacteria bacterium GW2011_GWC2_39_8]|uniref:Uncharacterized protein n=1 Tax=Candidatus Gottesmanbacteria bacterium GW2011_GWC2_39_8 TaxID=1618450 RepID=A0A0G0SCH9_9BACT|nr:MAG: hypothetical protein UT63_C0044G0007 [Candidatus Gottesmanbacteria bacterium GW2011_GWC2_39_8]
MLTKTDLSAIKALVDSAKKELKDDIANFKDEIIGRIQKSDEELAVIAGNKDQLENHEERIGTLEKSITTQ